MAYFGQVSRAGLLWLTVLITVGCLVTIINCQEDEPSDENDDLTVLEKTEKPWAYVKDGLQNNRLSMCSFLLLQVSNRQLELTLNRVTELFEQALDHMAKSAEYSTTIKPHVKAETIEEFDKNGSAIVLQISEERRKLIDDYRRATDEGSSELDLKAILENYFLKACAHKLATIIAERSMFSSMLKLETVLEKKPQSNKSESRRWRLLRKTSKSDEPPKI